MLIQYSIYQSIDLSVCDDDHEHWLKIDKLALDASANQLGHSSESKYVIRFVEIDENIIFVFVDINLNSEQ